MKHIPEHIMSRIKKNKNRTSLDWEKILSLYINGMSEKDIAIKLDEKQCSVSYVINSSGIEKNQKDIIGSKNPRWKDGVCIDRGRKMIYSPNHPNAMKRGRTNTPYMYEYRLVAEKKIGRYLKKGEIVHHIDGDVTNNSPDNLSVMSQSEHCRLHFKK